ncbi:MAG: tyrosine-type recombinase/integrase [Thermoproteaceae archaeon]|nr:tyrosine-type recombinase/integrase [Thermoproteaceae archaeon]
MSVQNPYWLRLSDEQRRGIIACLRELGLSLSDIARAAGVNPSTVHAWLSGRAAPQADKLERLYSAMPETVERCLPEPPINEIDIVQAISVIAKALRAKKYRDYVIDELSKLLPGQVRREIAYRVEREDVELFRGKLIAEGVSRDTVNYYVRYLVRFLDMVGWVLSPETLQRVYTIERPRVTGKTAVALKRFIDTVVRVKDPQLASLLYDSFKTVQSRARNSFRVPTLEEVRRVWEEAHKISPCAAAVWGIMAETGVRLDHLLRARLDGLQLEKRRLLLGETEGPKRQPLVFLTEGAVKYLKEVYLPWREKFCRQLQLSTERLFPCQELTVYRWLKEARERAGLPWLEPRLLRKFFAQWLLDRGVDVADIAVLQGRSLPGGLAVTVEHYIADYERRLRAVFEQHAPRVFP